MMRKYFYGLLHRYLSLYIFPGDRFVEIDPAEGLLFSLFVNKEKAILSLNGAAPMPGAKALASLKDMEDFAPRFVLLNGNLHYAADIEGYLQELHRHCGRDTRLIITTYSSLWRPIMKLADVLKVRRKTPEENWISPVDMGNLLYLAGFEPVKRESKVLIPVYIPILSGLVNRYLAPLPGFNFFTLLNILVARPVDNKPQSAAAPSVSVVIPARNESGNIESLVLRTPAMGLDDEIIFIEGHSKDDTWQKIQEVQARYGDRRKIVSTRQDGSGKGDAVRKAFSLAKKDILMILDADMTVPPEDLPRFYRALTSGKGEFINGSRLVYPMEKQAMRFLNMIANKFFAMAFSFVLGQKFNDTLCGTKVLTRESYRRIAAARFYFGDFDPFGDFDLIFGAARSGLRIVEIPIRYKERTYGTTNISRWKHGLMLLRMLMFAARKIKFL
jgi:hypothetical protein